MLPYVDPMGRAEQSPLFLHVGVRLLGRVRLEVNNQLVAVIIFAEVILQSYLILSDRS